MRSRSLGPILFFATIACLPTWRFVFAGKVPAPVDQVHQAAPWNGPKPESPWDILQLDGALQFLPWRDLVLDSMRKNEVPLWNPYTFSGQPLLGNSQSAPLYPLHWLWSLTPFGAEGLLAFSAWLHLFIAGLGVHALIRKLGGSLWGGFIGGSGLALSGFFVGWLQLPSVDMTASWIPWCLWGVCKLFDSDESKSRSVATLGICGAMMLLAGHLQIAVYGLLACSIVAIWFSIANRRLMPLMLCGFGLLISLCVSSPQLFTSISTGSEGHRAQPATEAGWKGYSRQALELKHLSVAITPYAFGMPNEPTSDGITGYWLARSDYGRHYAELAFYVGPVMIALAIIGLIRRKDWKESVGFLLIAATAYSISMGGGICKLMYFYVPGWAATGSPGRVAVLMSLALCVLAGLAFREKEEEAENDFSPILKFVSGAAVLFVGILLAGLAQPPGDEMFSQFVARAQYFVALFVVGCALAVCALLKSKYAPGFRVLATVCSIAGLFCAHFEMNPGSERGLFNQPFEGLDALRGKRVAVMNSDWSFFVCSASVIAPPNSLLPYRITEVGGYDSIIPKTTKARLDMVNGRDSAPEVNGNMMFLKPGLDIEKLALMGAEVLMTSEDLPLRAIFRGRGWAAYEVPRPAPPPFTASYSEVHLLDGSGRRVQELETLGWVTTRPGLLEYRTTPYVAGNLLSMLGIFSIFLLYCVHRNR